MRREPAEFWASTPRQVKASLDAASHCFIREHNERAWLAWHVAQLSRMKKMPALKRLLAKQPVRARQTWKEQLEIMEAWGAATQKKELTDGR